MSTNEDVVRIIEILDFRRQPEPIKKKHARRWFESTNANVVGAALDAILRNWECVEPPLTRRELGDLLMKNFQISLRSRAEKLTQYAYSCHEAAREFYRWILAAHATDGELEAQECVAVAKDFLAREYRSGDEQQRNCIVAGALEHLFEVERLEELFAEWRDDATLSEAYRKAVEWSSWARSRKQALHSVAERTADLMRHRGLEDIAVRQPGIGTTMAVVTWYEGEHKELAITCDEAWVQRFKNGEIHEKNAAAFAANAENWSESADVPWHFRVELQGRKFARR